MGHAAVAWRRDLPVRRAAATWTPVRLDSPGVRRPRLVELGTRAADGREVTVAIALWCVAALVFVLAVFSTIYDQRERRDTARSRRRHPRH